MGKNSVRRYVHSLYKYTDKDVAKHKHNFIRDVIVALHKPEGCIFYYRCKMCDSCKSFKTVEYDGSLTGFIRNGILPNNLPIIHFKSSHNAFIFKDITYMG